MNQEQLFEHGNQPARELWQYSQYEVASGQREAREDAINAKSRELALRFTAVHEQIDDVANSLGVRNSDDQKELSVAIDPETGATYTAVIGMYPSGTINVTYLKTDPGQLPERMERVGESFDGYFTSEGEVCYQTLDLTNGEAIWTSAASELDGRHNILETADWVVGRLEETVQMLSGALSEQSAQYNH